MIVSVRVFIFSCFFSTMTRFSSSLAEMSFQTLHRHRRHTLFFPSCDERLGGSAHVNTNTTCVNWSHCCVAGVGQQGLTLIDYWSLPHTHTHTYRSCETLLVRLRCVCAARRPWCLNTHVTFRVPAVFVFFIDRLEFNQGCFLFF